MIRYVFMLIIIQIWIIFQYGFEYNINISKTSFPISKDIIWNHYINEVYGKVSYDIDKHHINYIYKNAPIKVIPLDWSNYFDIFSSTKGIKTAHVRRSYPTNEIYNDYSWVEVTREAHIEGLIGGNLTYGCWFHKFNGTGIFVNIGRSIIYSIKDKDTLWPINHTYYKEHPMIKCHKDQCLCPKVLASGYDSVQFEGNNGLVICGKGCEKTLVNETCPPMKLRKGINANEICNCSEQTILLNCGNSLSSGNMYSNIDYNNNIIRSITCISKDHYIKSIPVRFNITLFMNYNTISRTNSLEYHKIKSILNNNQYFNVIMLGYRQHIYHKNKFSFYYNILKGFINSYYNVMNFHMLDVTNIILNETFIESNNYEDQYNYETNYINSLIIRNNELTIGIIRYNYNYIFKELKKKYLNNIFINNFIDFIKEEILCLYTFGTDSILMFEENIELNELSYDNLMIIRNSIAYNLKDYIDTLFIIDNYKNLTDPINVYNNSHINSHSNVYIEIISLEYNITREINIVRTNNKLIIKSNNV